MNFLHSEVNVKRICQSPIEIQKDVIVYCVLEDGHKGGCEPEKYPGEKALNLLRYWRKLEAK